MRQVRLPLPSGEAGAKPPRRPARGRAAPAPRPETQAPEGRSAAGSPRVRGAATKRATAWGGKVTGRRARDRSEEHTSELQSLMRISYAVFCLKKKKNRQR